MVRIGGLASGMDIDTIVGDLMKAERMPLDKLKQQKQTLEWQRDDYRSMNSLLLNFRNELGNLKLTNNYRARSVTSTNSELVTATASSAASKASYEIKNITSLAKAATKVSGSLSGSSANKIDPTQSIKSQSAKFAGSADLTWSQGFIGSQAFKGDGTKKDFDLTMETDEKVNTDAIANMSVRVNGKSYTVLKQTDPATTPGENQVMIDASGNLLFKDAITKDATIKVDYVLDAKIEKKKLTESTGEWKLGNTDLSYLELDVTIGGNTKKYTPVATAEAGVYALENAGGKIGTINYKTGAVTFDPSLGAGTEIKASYKQEYTGFNLTTQTSKGEVKENFLLKATDSLNQVINTVNNSGAGITMFYDSYADKVSLTRTETGDFRSGGVLSDTTTGKINQIATSGAFVSLLQLGSEDVFGENAVFTINGMDTRRSTNTFEMTGVTFTLKKTTVAGETASMSVNNDTNKVFENIKAFVEKYNELVDKVQKKTNEQYYRDYKPLTDEQREGLSDKQQEQWEEKAKSGLLKRDPILTQVLSSMRSDFYAPVENANVDSLFKQLASIGITTTAVYQDGGKLEIKDDVLKKAIEDNPESVENFFRGTGNTKSEQGVIHRLYETVTASMGKLRERAGSANYTNKQFTLGRQLDNVYSQINRFESRLTQVEDRYWRQFTAMEKAIQKSNSQSAYLMQQFSGA